MPTQRINTLRDRALRFRRKPNAEWDQLYRESYARTEGVPAPLRTAKALDHCFRSCQVLIHDQELIVGDAGPEVADEATQVGHRFIFGHRDWQPPPWWPMAEELKPFFRTGVFHPAGNHTTMDYGKIFQSGFNGLLKQIDERLARLEREDHGDPEKTTLLQSMKTVAEAYIAFCGRYSDRAAELAEVQANPARKKEMETISANCRRVIAEPPTTFWAGCQCAWFSFNFLPDAPGRLDQYLYPLYRADMQKGAVTREFAKELLSSLWLKYLRSAGIEHAVSAYHHLTLGGVTADGKDASNEVTKLCLEVTAELKLNRPQIGLRVHKGTPDDILRCAVEALKSGSGNPDFCNDDVIVPALARVGVAIEDARDFSLSGCHEVIVTGKAQMGSVEGFINMPKLLRIACGLEPEIEDRSAKPVPLTWEDFRDSVVEVMNGVAQKAHEAAVARDTHEAGIVNLQASLVTSDCIEKVRGYAQGGARYNFCNWNTIGVANFADSMTAIRRLVFTDRLLTLEQFMDILRNDWAGQEALRQRVLNHCPHYGNDDKEADDMASWTLETLSGAFGRFTPYRGGRYILGTLAGGENMHTEFGMITGATPDGRKAGTPLADSIGPAQGRDRKGVTAMLNSVSHLPHGLLPTATTLNVKLNPSLLAGAKGVDLVMQMIRAHFASGGQQFQFNLVTREMLLEAKRDPDRHGDLIVRVAGYSAPFLSLRGEIQEEVISRTAHEL